MTTVACDGKSMSTDSLETAGDVIVGSNIKKLWRLRDGSIVGCAGKVSDVRRFLDWLQSDRSKSPPAAKGCTALILSKSGKLEMFEDGVLMSSAIPAALGTGYISALTAMDMGADSKEAVRRAIQRDVFSGGPIQTLRL